MNYKSLKQLVKKYSNNRWLRNVSRDANYHVAYAFINDPTYSALIHDVVYQTNVSQKKWYKGEHAFKWFKAVIKDIHEGFETRDALANNSHLSGYKKDKTHHRKLFYKMLNMMRKSLSNLCNCKCEQDFLSLNFLAAFKFGSAGRSKTKYLAAKINDVHNYPTYDEFIVRLWHFVCVDTKNCKSLLINLLNDSNYDKYLTLFYKSLDTDERLKEHTVLMKIYKTIKSNKFFKELNRYQLEKILVNNGVKPKKRQLGNKPATITRIRMEGLFQVDVKVTHCGDLKYIAVGYWMVIVEVEHVLIFRWFQTSKPTGRDHVKFLNAAKEFYKSLYQINFISIQMDNAPEYAMSHTAYEIVLHNDFVKSVGEWCVLNKIKHINIRKGRKESNGKVENTNRMIDYELLPLVHRVKSVKDIKDITKHYDNLHNTLIRRTFKRIINGTLKKFVWTPVRWLEETRTMVRVKKLIVQEDSCYYSVAN